MRGNGIKPISNQSLKILELERLLRESNEKMEKHIKQDELLLDNLKNIRSRLQKEMKAIKIFVLFWWVIAWIMVVWFIISWTMVPKTYLSKNTHVSNIVQKMITEEDNS